MKSSNCSLLGWLCYSPSLIRINSQASNDTFVILFSTLAIYCFYLFIKNTKAVALFLLTILFASLAVASKTNGWVTVIAIFLSLLIKAFSNKTNRFRILSLGLIFAVITSALIIINPLTQYIF